MKKKQTKKGFTLIEIIIYMGLLAGILVILSQVFTSIIQAKLDSESTSGISQDATYIMNKLSYDIARAQAIVVPSNFTASNSLQITIAGVTNTYALASGNLQVTNSTGTSNLNGYNTTVSNLQLVRVGNGVTPLNNDSIQITFTVTSAVRRASGNESKVFQITVAPR